MQQEVDDRYGTTLRQRRTRELIIRECRAYSIE